MRHKANDYPYFIGLLERAAVKVNVVYLDTDLGTGHKRFVGWKDLAEILGIEPYVLCNYRSKRTLGIEAALNFARTWNAWIKSSNNTFDNDIPLFFYDITSDTFSCRVGRNELTPFSNEDIKRKPFHGEPR
jgi:hypothetical protein